MLTTIALLAALAAPVPDFDSAARLVADSLRRENPSIVPNAANYDPGALGDAIEMYDDFTVLSSRVAEVTRTEEKSAVILVEIEAVATTIGTRREVALPRWWSVELEPAGHGWRVTSAGTLERWLAGQLALAQDEQLSAALRRPDVDPQRLLTQLARTAKGRDACNMLLWVLGTSQRQGLWKSELHALRMLSYVEAVSGNPAGGVQLAERSVELAERTQDPDQLVEARFGLGFALWYADRPDEAVKAFEAAGALIETVDDPRQAIRAVHMAGLLEHRRNRMAEALVHAERQEVLAARYRLPRTRMTGAALLSSIHSQLGNVEVARRQDELALEASREMYDRRLEAIALFNLGAAALDNGEHARANDLLHHSLTIGAEHLRPGELIVVQQSYAHLQLQEHDTDGADETLEKLVEAAARLDERRVLSAGLLLRAEVRLLQTRVEEALTDARQARRLSESGEGTTRTHNILPLVPALTTEGRALRASGRNDAAEAVWRSAIDIAEAELAQRPVDEQGGSGQSREVKLRPYRELLNLLVDQGCIREALTVAERMRARALRDALRHGRVDLSGGLDEAARAREQELELRISEVNRALLDAADPGAVETLTRERREARLALRRFQSELYLSRMDLRARRPATLDEDASWEPEVEPGELVLELVVSRESTIVFALREKDGRVDLAAHRLPIERSELEERVNAFVASLENRDFSYRQEARALHDLLLGAVAAEVASAARLRIVPDGVLWRVPFHVLVDQAAVISRSGCRSPMPPHSPCRRPAGALPRPASCLR
jgi:tetratricopeptide (TPR) repeat protein